LSSVEKKNAGSIKKDEEVGNVRTHRSVFGTSGCGQKLITGVGRQSAGEKKVARGEKREKCLWP